MYMPSLDTDLITTGSLFIFWSFWFCNLKYTSGPTNCTFEYNILGTVLFKLAQLFLEASVRGTAVSECSQGGPLGPSFSVVLLMLRGL